jgi:hypothetical protein
VWTLHAAYLADLSIAPVFTGMVSQAMLSLTNQLRAQIATLAVKI